MYVSQIGKPLLAPERACARSNLAIGRFQRDGGVPVRRTHGPLLAQQMARMWVLTWRSGSTIGRDAGEARVCVARSTVRCLRRGLANCSYVEDGVKLLELADNAP